VKERDNYSILGGFTAICFGQVLRKAVGVTEELYLNASSCNGCYKFKIWREIQK